MGAKGAVQASYFYQDVETLCCHYLGQNSKRKATVPCTTTGQRLQLRMNPSTRPLLVLNTRLQPLPLVQTAHQKSDSDAKSTLSAICIFAQESYLGLSRCNHTETKAGRQTSIFAPAVVARVAVRVHDDMGDLGAGNEDGARGQVHAPQELLKAAGNRRRDPLKR